MHAWMLLVVGLNLALPHISTHSGPGDPLRQPWLGLHVLSVKPLLSVALS